MSDRIGSSASRHAPRRSSDDPVEVVRRRTSLVLISSIVPAGAGLAAANTAMAVLGEDLTASDTLGGVASSMVGVGAMVSTVPLSRAMLRHGRRWGLVRGWSTGAIGSGLAIVAAFSTWYPILVAGSALIGVGLAANLATRYAAADLALPHRRARAISMVVWTSTLGSVVGPTLGLGAAGDAAEAVGMPALSGAFWLSAAGFVVAATVTGARLRPDPLAVAGTLGDESAVPARRPLAQQVRILASVRTARLAVAAMVVGHAVMVAVMTMTPLHLTDGGHELRLIGFVISVHVFGMYAFSPVIGWVVDRVGPHFVVGAAGVGLALGAELAANNDASDSTGAFVGLFLIGVGWSCGLIAGSALLTGAFDSAERVQAQGAADLIMVGAGAGAGMSSGLINEWFGYHSLSHGAAVLSLVLIVTAMLPLRTRRPRRH